MGRAISIFHRRRQLSWWRPSIGVLAGLAAGYLRGWADVVISRLVDILLGFPYLIFAIALIAMTGAGPAEHRAGAGLQGVGGALPGGARRDAGGLESVEYVEAARALGASAGRDIMLREILPNILSPVLVVSTVRMAHVIILEASLSFLGLGVQPPTAAWGSMVADGRSFMLQEAWWLSAPSRGLRFCCWCWPSTSPARGCGTRLTPEFHD